MTDKSCWTITDDKIGNQAQAQGLAEAVGFKTIHKTITLKQPWRTLPPVFWPPGILGISSESDALSKPWPDLIISCGRQSVGVAAEIKRRARDKIMAVHIQHPRISLHKFDLIAAPSHDNLKGSNVISTLGSLGRVNREMLDREAGKYATHFANLPRPLVAVSIGGTNSIYTLERAQVTKIAEQLKKVADETNGSLLVTTSRRTGSANADILRDALKDVPGQFWDGKGDNPYFAYLGSADYVVVTGDSVNMISEACATGKPVYVIHMQAERKSKFENFHKTLEDMKLTRPFDGKLDHWQYIPLAETVKVAARIHTLMREINNQKD